MTVQTIDMPTWKFVWRLIRYRPWHYLSIILLRSIVIAGAFQAIGLIIRAFFDTLTGARSIALWGTELGPWELSALLVFVALIRAGGMFADVSLDIFYRFTIGTLMRKNLFSRILDRVGTNILPGTTGDALSRFQGDVEGVIGFIMRFPHLIGMGILTVSAIIVMLTINTSITLLAFLPLVIIVTIANVAMRRGQIYHNAVREASSNVSSSIGEMFGAVQAIKVASAEERMLGQFDKLNEVRRKVSLLNNLFATILNSVFENIGSLSTGLILILVGYMIQAGSQNITTFTIGDLALFVYYLGIITGFTSQVGELSAEYKRTQINHKRLQELIQGDSAAYIVDHTPVYLRGELPPLSYIKKNAQHRLETLQIKNLSYNHPQTNQGIHNINFGLTRGTLTVITGRIGSGKTTLLRVLLGLLPKDSGEILWNNEIVSDPGSFFIPPRCAYTPQVPVLFSDSVRDNILMGLPEEAFDLQGAIRLAVMEQDVETLQDGLQTIIGVRGVRLSGGQALRTAAARMFIRDTELFVFDDLSSALDVETERELWHRSLDQEGVTYLAISHRKPVLQLANNIVLLKEGKIEAAGNLESLLETSQEMQYLWQSELDQKVSDLE
jgi:ATP-binding cassette, subfamily B, bacterial